VTDYFPREKTVFDVFAATVSAYPGAPFLHYPSGALSRSDAGSLNCPTRRSPPTSKRQFRERKKRG
jgi:hypothetical protein